MKISPEDLDDQLTKPKNVALGRGTTRAFHENQLRSVISIVALPTKATREPDACSG